MTSSCETVKFDMTKNKTLTRIDMHSPFGLTIDALTWGWSDGTSTKTPSNHIYKVTTSQSLNEANTIFMGFMTDEKLAKDSEGNDYSQINAISLVVLDTVCVA